MPAVTIMRNGMPAAVPTSSARSFGRAVELSRAQRIRRHPEREGEHVGGAAGKDRERHFLADQRHRDLAQRAVAAEPEHDLAAAEATGVAPRARWRDPARWWAGR